MRIIESANPRPLNLLAVGAGGLVAAASATFGARGGVEVWHAPTGTPRFVYPMPYYEPGALAFTPDGRLLLIGEGGAAITALAVASGVPVLGPPVTLNAPVFALAADGEQILVISRWQNGRFGGAVECLWTGPDGAFRQLWIDGPHGSAWFDSPALTFDGRRAAVAARSLSAAAGRAVQLVSIRDADTGKQLISIPLDPASPVQQLAFTADGAKLLVRTDSRTVQMFDATTGAPAGELVHTGRPYVTGVAVHPRGPVACARTNGTVTFWNAETREQLRTLDWKAGKLVSVAFSPDGALGAAGTEDGKVIVWDVDI